MNYQNILVENEGGIITLTLNREKALNALNQQTMQELKSFFEHDFEQIGNIVGVIITGAGSKAFVAGADITEFIGMSNAGEQLAQRGQDIFLLIERFHRPVIAAVNGFALGGGCELAMACHIRIASPNAKFGQPEVNLGLIPGYGGTQRLVQLIGKGRAIELLISAVMIDANTALQYGLVNYVVPASELLNKARAILDVVNTKAPLAIAKCIEAANAALDETKNGYEVEITGFGNCFGTEDMKEGTTAFIEKRKAVFTGN